jgi:hypothetical protein
MVSMNQVHANDVRFRESIAMDLQRLIVVPSARGAVLGRTASRFVDRRQTGAQPDNRISERSNGRAVEARSLITWMGQAKGWIMPLVAVAVIAFVIGFGIGVESASGRPNKGAPMVATESPWDSIPWSYGGGGGGLANRR